MFKKEAFLGDLKTKMEKSLDSLRKDLSRVRTGRASLNLLDGVRVNYYGTPTPLSQVASLSVPESRTISIQPWDAKIICEIEKAIQKSDLGLNPLNDGKVVRINIPRVEAVVYHSRCTWAAMQDCWSNAPNTR